MAQYYMHVRDLSGEVLEDVEGAEFPSLALAKKHALAAMHDLLGAAIRECKETNFETILIVDDKGTQLAAVPVVAALPSIIIHLLKQPEKVVPTDRFEEYRRYADDCRKKAEGTEDIDDKVSWLKLANAWLHMLPPPSVAGWPASSSEDSAAEH